MLHDQLGTNEGLNPGQSKTSNNGRLRLTMGRDGNLVLSDVHLNKALWASGTKVPGAHAWMNWDGNLSVQDQHSKVLWDTRTGGHKNAHAILQNDGNFVIYKDSKGPGSDGDIWASGTYLFKPASMNGAMGGLYHRDANVIHWAGNAVKTAGHAVGDVTHAITEESGKISKELSKIPVVGGLLHGLYDSTFFVTFGPMVMTEQVVIEGQRIDRVAMKAFQDQLKDFKEVGPYAQMVCSFIPGIGTGISAAIGAGLALANGQPITEVLLDGVKGALPGGPLARMAFDIAQKSITAAVEHKKFDIEGVASIGVGAIGSALNLSPQITNILQGGLHAVAGIASGKPLDKSLIAGISDALPIPDTAKKALAQAADFTVSLAQGQRVDKALMDRLGDVVNMLPVSADIKKGLTAGADIGKGLINGKPIADVLKTTLSHTVADVLLDHAKGALPKEAQSALNIGIAMAQGKSLQAAVGPQLKSIVPEKLAAVGDLASKAENIVSSAAKMIPPQAMRGFNIGVGLMKHQINLHQFVVIRNSLSSIEKKAFDTATSLHIGRVTQPPPKTAVPGITAAAFYMTNGVRGAYMNQKIALLKVATATPEGKAGTIVALQSIAQQDSWWTKVLKFLGVK